MGKGGLTPPVGGCHTAHFPWYYWPQCLMWPPQPGSGLHEPHEQFDPAGSPVHVATGSLIPPAANALAMFHIADVQY